MKGKGPKHERETIVIFNEKKQTTSIWTASEVVYRRLKKAGYIPTQDGERSASFELPTADIRLPSRRLFEELTPVPTRKNSIRFITTYSGFSNESQLLWDLYKQSVGRDEHPDGQGERIHPTLP